MLSFYAFLQALKLLTVAFFVDYLFDGRHETGGELETWSASLKIDLARLYAILNGSNVLFSW